MIKKSILLLALGLILLKTQAQTTFEYNYLGNDFMLYKGVFLKLVDNPISGLDYNFYSNLERCYSKYPSNVIYPDIKYKFQTVKDSMMNRIFLVENIVDKNGHKWDENSKTDYFTKPLFILKDTLTGQKIYYKYDIKNKHNFPFNTSEINYPANYFCSKIQKTNDDFTNEIQFNSPLINEGKLSSISIYKYISKGNTVYYLSLITTGKTVNVNKNGVIILFEDGTKWTRSSKINVDSGSNGFDYSAFITLTPNDLRIFSTKKIKKFRLYIYDKEINSGDAERFRLYTECIQNKNN